MSKKPTLKSRRIKSGKKVSGQKGHTVTTFRMVDIPDDITQPVQYGSQLRAFAVYLYDYRFIPYDHCCELLSDVYECKISPAILIRAENECFKGLEESEVPFNHNQAERNVRMMKVHQKTPGTFKSVQSARSFCHTRGYISNVKKNKLSVIDAIGAVFDGKPFVPFMDSV